MTSRDFVYWLQGYFEVTKPESIPAEQVKIIQNRLNLVLRHEIDPTIDGGIEDVKEELQQIHDGIPGSGFSPMTKLRC